MPFESDQNEELEKKRPKRWQLALRRFFHQAWVEITIGCLVILSVFLTLFEFWLEFQFQHGASEVATIFGVFGPEHLGWMTIANESITTIFIIELSLRFFAAGSKRQFFREFWLDILATLPLFRVFRAARALRLLRLVRLLRLLGVISRLSSHYPYIFRRGAIDFLIICGLLLLAVVFGTLAIMHFENQGTRRMVAMAGNVAAGNESGGNGTGEMDRPDGSSSEFDLSRSFWFSIYTLFAGEPIPQTPRTFSGKLVTVFLMFMGLTIFAIFAGTVSAFMVDRMRMEGRIVEWDSLQDHIVICGWTPKTKIIIDEYRASDKTRKTPIVVITELDHDQMEDVSKDWPRVHFVHDDFTKVSALERAGIHTAKTCLVLSDTNGNRSEQDADARTILASLTVEKINESVYTCAELINRSYATHLETGHVNDFVVSGEYGAHMLAQAAMNRGLIGVLSELLTYQHGNEFYRLPIPESWVGESFDQKLGDLRGTANSILVAVHPEQGEAMVNPVNYQFAEGDEVIVISRGTPKLS